MNEVLDAFERHGLSRSDLVHGIRGLEGGRGADGSLIEVVAARRIWWRAARVTRDPLLGLRVGRSLSPRATGVVAIIRWHSPTFGESLRHLLRYQHLLSESGRFVAEATPDGGMRLVYRARAAALPIHPMQIDSVVAAAIAHGPRPAAIGLVGARGPNDRAAFAEWLGCPVVLGAHEASIDYGAVDLARPIAGADPALCAINVAHAEALLNGKRRTEMLCAGVAAALDRLGYDAGLRQVAREVGLSPRTLQRSLAGVGVGFKGLVQAQRMDRALLLLSQTTAGVEAIGLQLGYADASAFSRAVSNWWGQGPRALRRSGEPPALARS